MKRQFKFFKRWLKRFSLLGALLIPYLMVAGMLLQNSHQQNLRQQSSKLKTLTQHVGTFLQSEISYYRNLMNIYCTEKSEAVEDLDTPLLACGYRAHTGDAISFFNEFPLAPHLQRESFRNAGWFKDLESNSGSKLLLSQELGVAHHEDLKFSVVLDEHRFAIFDNQRLSVKLRDLIQTYQLGSVIVLNRVGKVTLSDPHASRVQFKDKKIIAEHQNKERSFDYQRETFGSGSVRFALYHLDDPQFIRASLREEIILLGIGLGILIAMWAAGLFTSIKRKQKDERRKKRPSLAEMLIEIVAEKRAQYRERRKLQISLELPANPGTHNALVDPLQFLEILSQLIDNSVEAIPRTHKGLVKIQLKNKNRDQVEVIVEDNGSGIPEKLMMNLGRKGFSHGRKKGKEGQGLHRVALATKRWGGQLKIASTVNKGTRIRLALPKVSDSASFALSGHFHRGENRHESNSLPGLTQASSHSRRTAHRST